MGTVQSILFSFSIYDYWWNDKVHSRAYLESVKIISYESYPMNHFSKHGAQFLEENDIFSPEDDDDDDDDDD